MMWGLARELGMREKAERAESIGDGDDEDAFMREPVAPVQRHRRRAVDVAAAVYPDDDGKMLVCALRRRPDVEVEAVFADGWWSLAWHGYTILHAGRGEGVGLARRDPGCEL